MHTTRGTSAAIASSIPAAARGGLLVKSQSAVSVTNGSVSGSILRNEDGGRVGAGLLHTFGDIGEDREAEVLLASLLGVCSTDYFGTCA